MNLRVGLLAIVLLTDSCFATLSKSDKKTKAKKKKKEETASTTWDTLAGPQGSILQSFTSAENFSDHFSFLSFGQISTLKGTKIMVYYCQ
jgi:hypothetical protein